MMTHQTTTPTYFSAISFHISIFSLLVRDDENELNNTFLCFVTSSVIRFNSVSVKFDFRFHFSHIFNFFVVFFVFVFYLFFLYLYKLYDLVGSYVVFNTSVPRRLPRLIMRGDHCCFLPMICFPYIHIIF